MTLAAVGGRGAGGSYRLISAASAQTAASGRSRSTANPPLPRYGHQTDGRTDGRTDYGRTTGRDINVRRATVHSEMRSGVVAILVRCAWSLNEGWHLLANIEIERREIDTFISTFAAFQPDRKI